MPGIEFRQPDPMPPDTGSVRNPGGPAIDPAHRRAANRQSVVNSGTTTRAAEVTMAVCEVCGNDYARSFEVTDESGDRHVFDSFECAIHRLAPVCAHCECRIIGHGQEADGVIYCCSHCARQAGVQGVSDNTETPTPR